MTVPQGVMLIVVGPFIDQLITSEWILDFTLKRPAMYCLFASCSVAVLVNISQFMCLGRFSAVTFQVGPMARARPHACCITHTAVRPHPLFEVAGRVRLGICLSISRGAQWHAMWALCCGAQRVKPRQAGRGSPRAGGHLHHASRRRLYGAAQLAAAGGGGSPRVYRSRQATRPHPKRYLK